MMCFGSRAAAVLAGVLAFSAVGCASNAGVPGQSRQATPSPADPEPSGQPTGSAVDMPTDTNDPACGEVPAALAGRWTKTTHPEDLPPELFDMDTGVLVMTLGPGHYYRTDVDDDHRGTDEDLCWTADRVAFVTYRDDCSGDAIGIYEWALRDEVLDLTEVSDECFWRPWPTTIDSWTRVR